MWKIFSVVWGKYRIQNNENGTWAVFYGGCTLFSNVSSLAKAKQKAEAYEKLPRMTS